MSYINRLLGAGSVMLHVVAQNGRTEPQLFRGAITSSSFAPSQYEYNAQVPEVRQPYSLYVVLQ